MIKRFLVNGLLTTVVQIVLYVIILYVCFTFSILIPGSRSLMDIGYPVIMSVLLLGPMLLIANLISSLINKKAWTLGILTIVAIIYFIAWIEDIGNWPLTTIIFIIVGLTTIYSKFFVDKKTNKLIEPRT